MFIVYKIVCSVNGKPYIGYTKHPLELRWSSHLKHTKAGRKTKLCNAIRKYGESNFSREVLASLNTKEEALRLEMKLIAEYNSRKVGYNITPGGEGGNTSLARTPEWNKHISEGLKENPKHQSTGHTCVVLGPQS